MPREIVYGTDSGGTPRALLVDAQGRVLQATAPRATALTHRSGVTTADTVTATAAVPIWLINEYPNSMFTDIVNHYYYSTAVRNRLGVTVPTAAIDMGVGSMVNLLTLDVEVPEISGALGYLFFCSTDASPKLIREITPAQRAAGLYLRTDGALFAGNPGRFRAALPGTGLAADSASFEVNTALDPDTAIANGVTPIAMDGYSKAHVFVDMSLTDLSQEPSLTLVPFVKNSLTERWHQLAVDPVPVLSVQTMLTDFVLTDLDSAAGLLILVQAIAGNGASVDITVERLI